MSANFTDQEKQLIAQGLNTFLQVASQQYPKEQIAELVSSAEGIMKKIEESDPAEKSESGLPKPKGISDEYFDAVCKSCEQYDPSGKCLDPITVKFPEKCDPILSYIRTNPKIV